MIVATVRLLLELLDNFNYILQLLAHCWCCKKSIPYLDYFVGCGPGRVVRSHYRVDLAPVGRTARTRWRNWSCSALGAELRPARGPSRSHCGLPLARTCLRPLPRYSRAAQPASPSNYQLLSIVYFWQIVFGLSWRWRTFLKQEAQSAHFMGDTNVYKPKASRNSRKQS